MKPKYNIYSIFSAYIIFYLIFYGWFFVLPPSIARAQAPSSTSFKVIPSGIQGSAGFSSSTTFKNTETGGENVVGQASSTTFESTGGITPSLYPPAETLDGGGGGITISGTVYSAEGQATTSTVALSVDGGTKQTVSTDGSGVYSFANVASVASSSNVTVWMDNGGAGNGAGATVMMYSGTGDITTLNIYKNFLRLRHDNAGPMTNTVLATCDKTTGTGCADTDLHFDVSGSAFELDKDWGLFIEAGEEFRPGGTVTLLGATAAASSGGDIWWGSSASGLQMQTNALSIGGDWRNDVAGISVLTSATTTFTATSSGFVINTGGRSMSRLVFNGINGVWSATTSAMSATGLTMSEGTFDNSNGVATIAVTGHVIGTNGVINMTADDHKFQIILNGVTRDFGVPSANWRFRNLLFSSASPTTPATINSSAIASTTITIDGYFAIGTSTNSQAMTFNANAALYNLTGTSGAPLTIDTLSVADLASQNSTFKYSGNNMGGNTVIRSETYYNLITNNGGETFTLSGATTSTNDMTMASGTLDVQENSFVIGNDFSVTTSTTFLASTTVTIGGNALLLGTVTFTGGSLKHYVNNDESLFAIGSNAVTLNNVYFNNVSSTALTITANSSSSRVIASSSVMIGGPEGSATTTLTTTAPFDIEEDLTVATSGVLVASSTVQFNIGKAFILNDTEQFTSASSTFVFDTEKTTSNGAATISGNPDRGYTGPPPALIALGTFHNLTITTGDTSRTVRVQRGGIVRVNGLLKLVGANSASTVSLYSSDNTQQWAINHQGTESLSYANVRDAACDGSSTNIHTNKTIANDSNNGSCWRFQDLSVLMDSSSAAGLDFSLSSANEWTATGTTEITVTSVSPSGYKLYAIASDELRIGATNSTIPFWSGTNATPTTWISTCFAASECGFGYTTDDIADLTQFSSTKFAGFTTSTTPGDLVAQNLTADSADVTIISYRMSVLPSQTAGLYTDVIYYTAVQEF